MLFGDDFVLAEQHMFNYAQRFCCDYDGGFWQFYTLPNGGGYMAPNAERVVFSSLNGFEAEISGDAAGMILTALVLNHRCWLHHEQGDDELAEHFIYGRSSCAAPLTTILNPTRFGWRWINRRGAR